MKHNLNSSADTVTRWPAWFNRRQTPPIPSSTWCPLWTRWCRPWCRWCSSRVWRHQARRRPCSSSSLPRLLAGWKNCAKNWFCAAIDVPANGRCWAPPRASRHAAHDGPVYANAAANGRSRGGASVAGRHGAPDDGVVPECGWCWRSGKVPAALWVHVKRLSWLKNGGLIWKGCTFSSCILEKFWCSSRSLHVNIDFAIFAYFCPLLFFLYTRIFSCFNWSIFFVQTSVNSFVRWNLICLWTLRISFLIKNMFLCKKDKIQCRNLLIPYNFQLGRLSERYIRT